MKTATNRFARIRDLFVRTVDLKPEQQDQLLQSECADDPELAQEVRALLAADSEMPSLKLTRAIEAAKKGPSRGPHEELVNTTLGPYKLVSILGSGGAGVVYLGERVDRKFSASVAIKVVDETADDLLGARFAAEIQILATLKHPNIARLIDAGESKENFPYIVMEYVHGEALDRHCDDKMLSIRQRLRLFLQVCSAVQYAHQNLVVHRDLKPGNILVTDDGTVKLLDFGIAKLLSTGAPTPGLTRLNDRALTPEYASPEQISGQIVTTASDVYSLGVLLYELLSGLSPYEVANRKRLDFERVICNVDPLKPSAAVLRASHPDHAEHEALKTAATARGVSVNRLGTALTGDLDAIVMRTLRKEPDKRYASVAMLAADIERHLNMEAVVARQGNWTYYTQRFLRRHWIPVSAATVVGLVLLASAIAMTVLYNRARIERDRAEQASQFMSAIFTDMNPDVAQGRAGTALDLLDTASKRLSDLSNDPELQARLRNQVGLAYSDLGHYSQAVEHLQKSVEIERNIREHDLSILPATLVELATAESGDGRFLAADEHYREAKVILERQQRQSSAAYAHLLRMMGRLETIRGDLKNAELDYQRSIELSRSLNVGSAELAQALSELGGLYLWTNDLPAAERASRESLSIVNRTLPPLHPTRIMAQTVLADVLSEKGNTDEVAILLEQSIAAQRLVYHNTGPELARSLHLLAWTKKSQGNVDEAEKLLRECLAISQRLFGKNHYKVGYYETSLARLLLYRHHLGEAKEHIQKSIAIFAASLPKDHQYIAASQYWLGEIYLAMHRPSDAVSALATSRQIWQRNDGARWFLARTESALGQALADKGVSTNVKEYLSKSYKTLLADRGPEDEATRVALRRLKAFLLVQHH